MKYTSLTDELRLCGELVVFDSTSHWNGIEKMTWNFDPAYIGYQEMILGKRRWLAWYWAHHSIMYRVDINMLAPYTKCSYRRGTCPFLRSWIMILWHSTQIFHLVETAFLSPPSIRNHDFLFLNIPTTRQSKIYIIKLNIIHTGCLWSPCAYIKRDNYICINDTNL